MKFQSRLAIVSLFLLFCVSLRAQQTGLSGKVTDASNYVIANATVEVKQVGAATFHTVTNGEGLWIMPSLSAGDYIVAIGAPGFSTAKASVSMLVGQTPEIDTVLHLGDATTSVVVTAEAVGIDTTSSAVAGNISPNELQGTPLNGRNYMSLATLVPGVKLNAITADVPVAGASESGKFQITMDGLQVSQDTAGSGFGQPRFSQDAIAQFQIITNRFDATLGRSAGVYVNSQSKAGTNAFHGGAFGYFRNDALNAPDPIARKVLPFSDQQYGGTFGGPIQRDKLWFFGSYEGERQPSTSTSVVPAQNNAAFSHPGTLHVSEYLGRTDYQINEKNHILLRGDGFTYKNDYLGVTGNSDPSRAYVGTRKSYGLVADWNNNINAHTVNDLRAGFHHFGWQNLPNFNTIEIIFPNTTVGGPYNYPQIFNQDTQQYRDDLFWLKGKHSVKIGAEYLYTKHSGFFQQNVRGRVQSCGGTPTIADFNTMFPKGTTDPASWNYGAISAVCNRGSGMLFVQGFGDFTINVPRSILGGWIQDDWKVLPRLTLNLGARYDFDIGAFTGGPKLTNGLLTPAGNDKNNIAPRLGFAWDLFGDGKTSLRGGAGLYYADISANQVIDQQIFNGVSTIQASVSGTNVNLANPFNGGNPATNPGAYTQAVQPLAEDNKVPFAAQYSVGLQRQLPLNMVLSMDLVRNRVYNDWIRLNGNLLVDPANGQRNLNPNAALSPTVTRACGNGSVSVDTIASYTAATKQVCNQSFTAVQQFFTAPDAGVIYNALQMSLRQTGSKLNTGLAYTWSKTTNSSDGPFSYPNKPFLPGIKDEWASATDDQRHSLTVHGEYRFRYGLSLSSLYRFGSGLAYGTSTGTAAVNGATVSSNRTLAQNQIPIAAGTVCPVGSNCLAVYAPLSHFYFDSGYGYWMMQRNAFRGVPYQRVDARLQETFSIHERFKATVAVEAFNVLNHTNPYSYTTTANNSSYGRPSSAGGSTFLEYAARQVQVLARISF